MGRDAGDAKGGGEAAQPPRPRRQLSGVVADAADLVLDLADQCALERRLGAAGLGVQVGRGVDLARPRGGEDRGADVLAVGVDLGVGVAADVVGMAAVGRDRAVRVRRR